MTQFILQLSMFWDEKTSTRSRGLKSCLTFFLWWCIWSVRTVDITDPVFFSNDFFPLFAPVFVSCWGKLADHIEDVFLMQVISIRRRCRNRRSRSQRRRMMTAELVGDFEFRGDLLRGLEEQPEGSRFFFQNKITGSPDPPKGWMWTWFLAGVVGFLSSKQLYNMFWGGQDT